MVGSAKLGSLGVGRGKADRHSGGIKASLLVRRANLTRLVSSVLSSFEKCWHHEALVLMARAAPEQFR